MDKYEYRLKTEKLLKLVDQKDYKTAMKIADTIDWRRVKSVSMLCTVSDIYEKNDNFEDAREILLIAYGKSPIGRMILYRLAELAVKMEDFEEAGECYEEFVKAAPKDSSQYILQYKILRGQGASLEQQIEVLENYKQIDYREKWAYELAKLYHEAGLEEKCVEACDDLILWFSEGKYVIRSMELKMQYKPLSPLQQKKYDARDQAEPQLEVADTASEDAEAEPAADESTEEVFQSMELEDVEEEEITEGFLGKFFRKKKIEQEFKRGYKAVAKELEAEQESLLQESADDADSNVTIKPVKVNVGPFDTINLQKELAKNMAQLLAEHNMNTSSGQAQEVKKETAAKIEDIENEQAVKDYLEEQDGQIALFIPDQPEVEKQITGQLSLEAILAEWEEAKKVTEETIKTEKKKCEEEVQNFQKTKDLMKAATIPIDVQKIMEELAKVHEGESERVSLDKAIPDENLNINESTPEEENEITKAEEPEELKAEEQMEETEEEKETETVTEEASNIKVVHNEDKEEASAKEEIKEEPEIAIAAEPEKQITMNPGELTKAQKKLFSYFVPVRGMEEQLAAILEADHNRLKDGTSRSGNILIIGRTGSGKTMLAFRLVKAIQRARRKHTGKVAKITAESLNQKDLVNTAEKFQGGSLIIEEAGKMTNETIAKLSSWMEAQTGETLIILEDERAAINALMESNEQFAKKFTSKVEIPIFINDELVSFGRVYAKEQNCVFDEMAILSLYTRIDEIQREDHAVTVAEVKDIIDEAINHAKRGGIKKLTKAFKRHSDEAKIILKEQDFGM